MLLSLSVDISAQGIVEISEAQAALYEQSWRIKRRSARQYLGRPASSAGVERLFSKAGKLYGDDKKAQDYTSLEHALFACAETE